VYLSFSKITPSTLSHSSLASNNSGGKRISSSGSS
jgi:hypothetical protein